MSSRSKKAEREAEAKFLSLLRVDREGDYGVDRALLFAQPQRRIKDYILGPQVRAVVKEQHIPDIRNFPNLRKEAVVRSTFNIELRVDIGQLDEERRKAFIDLTVMTARQFYSQAAMISSNIPTVEVTSIDRNNGKESYPIIDTPESEE